jgi:large subunit ribosomal protein L22
MGRAYRYQRRLAHIIVSVAERGDGSSRLVTKADDSTEAKPAKKAKGAVKTAPKKTAAKKPATAPKKKPAKKAKED